MTSKASPSGLQLLMVVAHPHDFTHMAGTSGRHVRRGDSVTVVCVTGGQHLHNEELERELRKPRDQQDPEIVGESVEKYGRRKQREIAGACALFGITDVTGQAENRLKAEMLFVTQGHTGPFASKRLDIGAGRVGWSGGFAYGEAFLEASSRIDDHLPVSDLELAQADLPTTDRMASIAGTVTGNPPSGAA